VFVPVQGFAPTSTAVAPLDARVVSQGVV